jgi:4-amino-4-deoxy-L-arabinose transferase-like glycosyltransferase
MQKLLGVLILMAGVIFPLVMVGWLALRMNKKPALPPNQLGLILAFNFMLPVALVLLGMSLMSPEFGAQSWVRLGWMVALAGAAVALLILGVSRGRRADQ